MADYGATQTSTSTLGGVATDIPVSAVVPPGETAPITTMGGPKVLDSNSKYQAPVANYVYNGDDVAQGAKADAAATDSTSSWTVIALLKGLYAKLAGTLTVSGAVTTSGTVTEANSAAIKTDLDEIATDTDNLSTMNTSLTTLAGVVSSSKAAVKAASGDFADGSITTMGANADAAVTGDTAGTLSAKFRGLNKMLFDMWDSTNHWLQVKVMNGNANGQALMANSSPVVMASDFIGPTGLNDGSAYVAWNDINNTGKTGASGGGMPPMVPFYSNGATYDAARTPAIFKPIKAVSITAGTPVSVWAPTSGKKFRVMGWMLSLSVAGAILFEDATGGGNEFTRTSLMAAGVGLASPPLGNGHISTTINNALFLDVTATGTVSGFIFGTEE